MHSKVALTFFESWLPSFRHSSSVAMLGTVKLWCDPSIVQTSSHTVIGGLPRRSGEATIVARSFDDHRSRVFLGHAGFDVIGFWCAGGGCPSVICPHIQRLDLVLQ